MGDRIDKATDARTALLQQLRADRRVVEADRLELETSVPRLERQHRRALRELTVLRYEGEPLYVAKVPLGDDDGRVASEFSKLQEIDARVAACRPLRRAGAGFVMAYVPAADLPDLFTSMSPSEWRAAGEAVVDAMVDLQNTGPVVRRHHRARPQDVLRGYHVGLSTLDPRSRAAVHQMHVGPAHGDLAAWNVRYDPATRRVGIVDWEDYRSAGLPALDIINFVATLAVVMHEGPGSWDDVYTRAFEQPGEYRDLATGLVRRWAARTADSARDTMTLLPAYCEAMEQRIARECRSTEHMFFATFARRFAAADLPWVRSL